MTPKEKAIELYEKMFYIIHVNENQNYGDSADKAALVVVDEIISACEYNNVESYNSDWWEGVKNEIKNL